MEFFLFSFFCISCIVCGFLVISVMNPVYNVFYLILSFFNASGLLLLLDADFVALLFIIVYVGAIAVLFLFVVMMLNIKSFGLTVSEGADTFSFYSSFFFGFFFIFSFSFFFERFFVNYDKIICCFLKPRFTDFFGVLDSLNYSNSNIEIFGQRLYTFFLFYFLVAGFILLVAMVGAIVLTLQSKHTCFHSSYPGFVKRQQVSHQLSRSVRKAVFLLKDNLSICFILVKWLICLR